MPVHGDRPWENVHVDHTELDVELWHSVKRTLLGRPWITLLIDSYSRRALAYYLTFDPPSYRSCMGVIRECVRLHHRLPECMLADGGSEFRSVYFEKLLARYRCDIQWRPPTRPRFGTLIERFIHTLNQQFIHNLAGNTKMMKDARRVTKEVNPKNHAVWDLPLLDEHLAAYFYEEYDTRVHAGLGRSPREEFTHGRERFNAPQPYIAFNECFLIDTLPSTKKETAKILRSRGIQVNGIYYRSNRLQRPELYGAQVEVRYDPFNLAHVYAFIGKEWIVCDAPPGIYAQLKNCTEREIKILSEEKRQLARVYGRGFASRAKALAENHALREDSERVQRQRLKDAEMRLIGERQGRLLISGGQGANVSPEKIAANEASGESGADLITRSKLLSFRRARRGSR